MKRLLFFSVLVTFVATFIACKQEEQVKPTAPESKSYTFKSEAVKEALTQGGRIEQDSFGLWVLKMPKEIPVISRTDGALNLVGYSGIGGFQGPPTLKFKSVSIVAQNGLYTTLFSPNPAPVLAVGDVENLVGEVSTVNFIHSAITHEGYTLTGVCMDVDANINVELYEFSVFVYISTVQSDMVARITLEYSTPGNSAQTLFFDPFPTTMANPFRCDADSGGLTGGGGH